MFHAQSHVLFRAVVVLSLFHARVRAHALFHVHVLFLVHDHVVHDHAIEWETIKSKI